MDKPITIVIADTMEMARVGLARRLGEKYPVARIHMARDGHETLDLLRREPVDLLLLDLSLKTPSGFELIRAVRQCWPATRILTQHADATPRDGTRALGLGAGGTIARSASATEFETAAQAVLSGHAFCPTDMISDLIAMQPQRARSGNCYGLTRREIDVALATIRHKKTEDVGKALGISNRTVESHRYSIYRKTGCRNVIELRELAAQFQPAALLRAKGQPIPGEIPTGLDTTVTPFTNNLMRRRAAPRPDRAGRQELEHDRPSGDTASFRSWGD